MEKYEYRPNGPVLNTRPYTVARITKYQIDFAKMAGRKVEPEVFADANTFEQACDLARIDRARLRDLRMITELDRHEIVSRATKKITTIQVPA